MTDQPADARRAWADHYAAVRERIAQGRAPARAKPPAPVVIVRTVVDRPQPPRTPARAPGKPPPPAPLTQAERDALPVAKPRPRVSRAKRAQHRLEQAQRKLDHAASVATLPDRFADVLARYEVTWRALTGSSQSVTYIRPRLEIYRALVADGWSYSAIGRACNRDHSSIMHYIKKWGRSDDQA